MADVESKSLSINLTWLEAQKLTMCSIYTNLNAFYLEHNKSI